MVVERPSHKSLRLTAMDNTGKIKIFLVMARPVEIDQLFCALVERINKRKISHPDELLCAASSNGEHNAEQIENGSTKHLAEEVTAATESDHDDITEPSPKKTTSNHGSSSSLNIAEATDN